MTLIGEIKVSCFGELREARCDIFDQHNGTYKVHFYPKEACRHRLEITYDHEHVPGTTSICVKKQTTTILFV